MQRGLCVCHSVVGSQQDTEGFSKEIDYIFFISSEYRSQLQSPIEKNFRDYTLQGLGWRIHCIFNSSTIGFDVKLWLRTPGILFPRR